MNETKCLNCKQWRICVMIEASLPVRGEFQVFEALYLCRLCLDQHGGVLGSYIVDQLKPKITT